MRGGAVIKAFLEALGAELTLRTMYDHTVNVGIFHDEPYLSVFPFDRVPGSGCGGYFSIGVVDGCVRVAGRPRSSKDFCFPMLQDFAIGDPDLVGLMVKVIHGRRKRNDRDA